MRRRVRLTESDLQNIIAETVKKVINEGLYGYPDDIDQIILCYENDAQCMKVYESIVQMLLKKAKRGVELSFDILVNSSVLKKFQQMAFRLFKQYQDNMTKESPYNFRKYVAEKMLYNIEEGIYS